jgi:two-component system, LytTR family, sensor kinase
MKPPSDRLLDFQGTGTDVPAFSRPRYGVRWQHVFLVATALAVLSTTLAWQFTRLFGKRPMPLNTLVVLNFSWWYFWALMAPSVVWLSQHFQFERRALMRAIAVHVPAVVVCSLAHIAVMEGVHWWLEYSANRSYAWWSQVQRSAVLYFDWEMMTYWAIVGLSHALLYYRESRARALWSAQLETKLAEARLNTLQQQLHPHFLFNTLHAISSLMHKDVEAADRVLMQLSDLLRITLEHLGQQEIALEAELAALSKYLEIERTRFADRLIVRFDVHADTLETRVPSLLLQPLVENAIKHGVARKSGPGHIDISARREGDKLRLEVRDDGVGLSEDALTALQKGIGVSTTRARLQHLFGADFRFEFHRLAQGLAVVVALPWRTEAGQIARAGAAADETGEGHDRNGLLRTHRPPAPLDGHARGVVP